MSAEGSRVSLSRGSRRRKAVLDLNVIPSENRDQEGTSIQTEAQQQTNQGHSLPPATIDVEAIDDDVMVSSPRAFAEAKNNSRRNHGKAVLFDVDSGRTTRFKSNGRMKHKKIPQNQPIINCDVYINVDSSGGSTRKDFTKLKPPSVELPPPPPPPPPPPEFHCPICMGPLVEEMSTKCGHIFCKTCIKAALAVKSKCPTCREKVNVKQLIRVFLPSTS